MIEVSRLTLLVLVELLLGLTLLSGFLLGKLMLRRSRVRRATQHLVERIQADKAPRAKRLRKLLEDDYKYTGERLEQGLHDLTQVEMKLYQNIINSYLKQDVVVFQQTDVDVENLVVGYQALELPNTADAEMEVELGDEQGAKLERLREENIRLSDELRVTMDTMGRMLNEYSSMFAGGVEGDAEDGVLAIKGSIDETDMREETVDNQVLEEIPIDNPQLGIDDTLESMVEIDDDESSSLLQEIAAESERDVSLELENIIAQADPEVEDDQQPIAEHSMMDELEGLDIEIPDVPKPETNEQSEAVSLEEEWAQLLADDAESQVKTNGERDLSIEQKSV